MIWTPNMKLWLPFESNSNDKSGNAYNATLIGSPSYGNGVHGRGINLNGTSQYVDLTTHVNNFNTLTQGTIVISFTWSGSAGIAFLLALTKGDDATNIFQVSIGNITGTFGDESLTIHSVVNNTTVLSTHYRMGHDYFKSGKHTIAYTVSSNENFLVINGRKVSLSYTTGSSSSTFFLNNATLNNTLVGVRRINNVLGSYLEGMVDNFIIYSKPLSVEDCIRVTLGLHPLKKTL